MPIVADAAVKVNADLKQFNSDLKGADKGVKSLGERMRGALSPQNLLMAGAGAFAGAQVLSFLTDATNAAAEFQDSVSATGVIFGEEAIPALEEWADEAHSAFGASKQDALAAANQFAVFGKSAGLVGEELQEFSTSMVQLGGDLASMFGGTTQDAITAVGAALRGESEPIRRYGVLLDDATLRQKAFEMGLISTTKNALTPQQRVLAAQQEILDQTMDAQGDFERTSDGMANSQRDLQAQLENVNIEIGEKMLPVMLKLVRFTTDVLVPAIQFLTDWVVGPLADGIDMVSGSMNDLVDTSNMQEDLNAALDANQFPFEELPKTAARTMGEVTATTHAQLMAAKGLAENSGVAEALAAPFEEGSERAVTAVENLYAGIAAVIAERESELLEAGGDAVKAWFDPQLWELQGDLVQQELEEANDELLKAQQEGTKAEVLEAKKRVLSLTQEAIELQMNLALVGTDMEQAAALSALATSEFMKNGLASNDDEIVAVFRAWRDDLVAAGARMQADAVAAGGATTQGLTNALERGGKDLNRAFLNISEDAAQSMHGAGYRVGVAWANGLRSARDYARLMAWELAASVNPALHGLSPPKEGPLKDIDKSGQNVAMAWVDGLLNATSAVRGASFALAGAFAPGLGGSLAPGVSPIGAGGSGPTFILQVEGREKVVGSREEVLAAWEQMASFDGGPR